MHTQVLRSDKVGDAGATVGQHRHRQLTHGWFIVTASALAEIDAPPLHVRIVDIPAVASFPRAVQSCVGEIFRTSTFWAAALSGCAVTPRAECDMVQSTAQLRTILAAIVMASAVTLTDHLARADDRPGQEVAAVDMDAPPVLGATGRRGRGSRRAKRLRWQPRPRPQTPQSPPFEIIRRHGN